jgi:hypothetical protein
MKQPMKALHSPGKHAVNTVHVDDVSGALWAAAKWIEPLGRKAADEAAGEKIPFQNDKKKIADVEGVVAADQTPVAPLFNLVWPTQPPSLGRTTLIELTGGRQRDDMG